jgi:hypothetical protein
MLKPFEKAFPGKDNWPEGRDNKSYQNDTEMVQVFNNNTADRSPTTSTKEFRPRKLDTYLPKPKK